MPRLYPSLISANLVRLEEDIRHLEPYCDGFHLDIMDNHFVPNLTFGADMVHAISSTTKKQLWIHLMVDDPLRWCATLQVPAHSIISFHVESTKNIADIIRCITEKNWLPSLAIKPKTDVATIFPWLQAIHQILVMSVEPGFSGQSFLPTTFTIINSLTVQSKKIGINPRIGIDGGVTVKNIARLAHMGVTDFAIASAIFGKHDPVLALKTLKKICSLPQPI